LPTRLPLPDGVADLVFALEIVEHLVDPAHLFDEARRLLKPGGALVITTPNIARIGSVMKLLAGRTNLEDVHPPTSERGGADWAPHLREYAPGELRAIAARAGFSAVGARCFRNEETDFTHRTPARRAIDLVKWGFGVVPHLRGSLLLVARR
jgi:SAM-dependent methyltransferase